ncbi:response regulator [bacterium]|nr:response regulator [bacterium]
MQFPYKILILDDDKLVTASLKSLLMLEGFIDVVLYNNPNEAVEYLKNNPRDVIISDFMMPEMNGLEFLSQAKKLYPNASMILLTGYADKENAIKAINEVGLYKYIEKPWDNDELVINIKNAYERAHLVDELEKTNKELKKYSQHLEELVKEKTANIIEMNEKITAVIDNCADGIITLDIDGKVNDINPACESFWGLSENILKTKSIEELFETQDINWQEILKDTNTKLLREIYIINVVNGNKIPVEISSSYIPSNNEKEAPKHVFVIRNINYQKEMDRLREDFIATLTHDLRTPSLASIQTLEYFLNGKLGQLTDKQHLLLSTMKKSQEDMLGLVNTLLEVYKYESGRLKLVKTQFDFEKLADECIEQVMPLAQSKKQIIEKHFVNLNIAPVYADRNEIRRVIINLLGNAVKYTQEEGKIEVKAEIDGNDLRFSVKDNGEGIFKKDIPKLFKRFSQGTQEKRSISTGLGLYLSKQIIDTHGGKIWLESDKGKGSEFFFLLIDSVITKEKDKVWAV